MLTVFFTFNRRAKFSKQYTEAIREGYKVASIEISLCCIRSASTKAFTREPKVPINISFISCLPKFILSYNSLILIRPPDTNKPFPQFSIEFMKSFNRWSYSNNTDLPYRATLKHIFDCLQLLIKNHPIFVLAVPLFHRARFHFSEGIR